MPIPAWMRDINTVTADTTSNVFLSVKAVLLACDNHNDQRSKYKDKCRDKYKYKYKDICHPASDNEKIQTMDVDIPVHSYSLPSPSSSSLVVTMIMLATGDLRPSCLNSCCYQYPAPAAPCATLHSYSAGTTLLTVLPIPLPLLPPALPLYCWYYFIDSTTSTLSLLPSAHSCLGGK